MKESEKEPKKEPLGDFVAPPVATQNQKTAKSKVLGAKLSEYELNLYEYSTLSLCEEIDIFFCKHNNPESFSKDIIYNEDSIRTKCQSILDILE